VQQVTSQVEPDLFLLPIPLSDSPLSAVNAYAVAAPDGIRLIDCGWNTPEAYEALREGLAPLGGIGAIREILITHMHPDHYGLAERLAAESGAPVLMHRLEAAFLQARYEDVRALVEQMTAWLRINGVPPPELEAMTEGSLEMLRRVGRSKPDVLLEGDETLAWGRYRFRVIWTPGHAAGLVCLHDPEAGVLISSDHVLKRISPHVGLHAQSLGNPLDDYLESLALVRDLPVRRVFPGHGVPFDDLPGRVDELIAHHEERLAEMERLLAGGEQSAYALASKLPWKGSQGGWDRLQAFQRRMAVTEVIAHLEYLHSAGRAAKRHREGVVFYRIP
jgi:glyoxylase-like metal-dependent hydrolase (beta-lactamase superfamily II)